MFILECLPVFFTGSVITTVFLLMFIFSLIFKLIKR